MAKIYIASKELSNGNVDDARPGEHSYWVYDPDGDPDSGDERVIRGCYNYCVTANIYSFDRVSISYVNKIIVQDWMSYVR